MLGSKRSADVQGVEKNPLTGRAPLQRVLNPTHESVPIPRKVKLMSSRSEKTEKLVTVRKQV